MHIGPRHYSGLSVFSDVVLVFQYGGHRLKQCGLEGNKHLIVKQFFVAVPSCPTASALRAWVLCAQVFDSLQPLLMVHNKMVRLQ